MFVFRLAAAAVAAASLASAQLPVIVKNDWVRVVRAANVPSQLSRPHVHLINRVMIHLDRGVLRIDNKETGIARDIPFRAGEVRWDPRVGLHTSENTGGSPIRIIEIELNDNPPRAAGADPKAKLPAPPAGFGIDMENDQVRILRVTLQPGQSAHDPTFQGPSVATRLGDGETLWRGDNTAPLANSLDKPAEWILVELK
jgi:hypothetical protein